MNVVEQIDASAQAPAHIPPELVLDFDYLGDGRLQPDLHDGFGSLLKDAPPLFYTPRNGGHWVAAGHEAAFEIARDFDLFSNAPQSPSSERLPRRIPISYDPPQHTAYRHVLVHAFSPKAVNGMETEIRTFAAELLDAVAQDHGCDFVSAVSEPLPVKFFMRMMGLPMERFAEFRRWVVAATGAYGEQARAEVLDLVGEMTAPLVRERMAERREDLISRIVDADVGDRKPSFEEVQAFCLMLFIAGLDTVVNGMSFGVRALAMNPAFQDQLRADPGLIPKAAEELLRRYAIAMPIRQVARDATYNGVPLKRGDVVLLALTSANLDPAAFEDPFTLDLNRASPHVTFGAGPHRCVGSHLARLELRILYEELLARIPRFRLDPDRPATFHSGHVVAIEALPLVW